MRQGVALVEVVVSERTRWHFVVLHLDGLVAVGECSDAGDLAGLVAELEATVPLLRELDLPGDMGTLMERMSRRVHAATGRRALLIATLTGGLEQMLSDYAAQLDDVPMWKWLGGSSPQRVPLYANINRVPGGRAPEDVAASARAAVGAGFPAIKCAPFDVPDADLSLAEVGLSRVRAIRAAIGDDIDLMVDCHERLPLDEVHRILPALEDLGIRWLEDAIAVTDIDALQELRNATHLPLAGGEVLFDAAEVAPAVDAGLIDVLMPDVKHAGGLAKVHRVAQLAGDVMMSPHNPSGPVATLASAHLFGVCPNAVLLEYQFGEVPWRSALIGGGESVVDGFLHLSDRPGLGATLDVAHPSATQVWSATL